MKYLIEKLDLPRIDKELTPFKSTYRYVYICKNCGAELYGEFSFMTQDTIDSMRTNWKKDQKLKPMGKKYEKSEAMSIIESCVGSYSRAKEGYTSSVDGAICPVCGAKLSQEKGYFLPDAKMYMKQSHLGYSSAEHDVEEKFGVWTYHLHSADEYFSSLEPIRKEVEGEQIDAAVTAFMQNCNLPVATLEIPGEAKTKQDVEALTGFILNLICLENNIYSLGQRLRVLYRQRLLTDRAVVFDINKPAYKIKTGLEKLRAAYHTASNAVIDAEEYQPDVSIMYPDKPCAPVLVKPGLFNKKKVQEQNEALTAKYQTAIDTYEKEVKRCDEEKARLIAEKRAAALAKAQEKVEAAKVALENAEADAEKTLKGLDSRPIPAKAAKEILDNEIAGTEELLKKTFAARNELYSYDIIFGKYRDVVALSSFYEYLMSGRCSSLDGADGAYNTYENEIRMNRVIAQLDTVVSSLEDIKQNQYMMYQELRNINTSLHHLNSTMDKALTSIQGIEANTTSMNEYMEHISNNSDVIAYNTAVTAYYSKVNAELTNALGYIVAFK